MTAPDPPAVSAEGLHKALAGAPILTGLSFELRRGELLGLVGANGRGKTTTLRILAGLMRPDAGTARIFGHDAARLRAPERRLVGYMSQNLSLYPELTVAENLRFRAALYDASASDMAAEAAARCGIAAVLSTRVDRLSGGWARRAQFAALLIGRPPLLLLDEPTNGLDLVTRRIMWRWMAELAEAGHCLIVSTHDIIDAEQCPSVLHYGVAGAVGPMPPRALAALHGAATLEEAVFTLDGGGRL